MPFQMKNGRAIKTVSLPTVPVTNCDNCGACCMHMGTPPGYAAYFGRLAAGHQVPDWFVGTEDHQRCLDIPDDVADELFEYYAGVAEGRLIDRTADMDMNSERAMKFIEEGRLDMAINSINRMARVVPIPCLWLDMETKRCKHYEWRPSTCRDEGPLVPGNEACLATRKRFRIPLPLAKA